MGMTLPALALVTLVVTSYLASLSLALTQVSGSVLGRCLTARGRASSAEWILPRLGSLAQGVALLRTFGRVAVVALVLAEVVGVGEAVPLTWSRLALSGVIAAILIWLFTSVIAAAVAEYATLGLIVRSIPILRIVHPVTLPLNWIFRLVDEATRRLTGANLVPEDPEDDLLASIEDTQREGGLDDVAATLLENVVEFTSTVVSEVMTPRTDIEGIVYTDDLGVIRAFIREAGHSRVPVYEESLDRILGILYVKDLVPYLGEDATQFVLRPMLREPIRVPETKPVSELLKDFQNSEIHLAIVVDEYGGTSGLVTIEDVLEEIVGEIRDEHEPADEEEPSLTRRDELHAEVDGRFRIDELNEELGVELPDDDFDTVAGLVLAHFGRVPVAGESFRTDGLIMTVLDATATQVRRIAIERFREPPATPEETVDESSASREEAAGEADSVSEPETSARSG